jgi:type IV fimbrial biogenesis protein FimT
MIKRRNSGLTLVELMVVIAIVALLVTFSITAITWVTNVVRLHLATSELQQGIKIARLEAIQALSRVTLCKSANGRDCHQAGGYEQGWIVFRDQGVTGQVDPGEEIIMSHDGFPLLSISGNRPVSSYISFVGFADPQLRSGAFQAGTITLCAGDAGKRLIMSRFGRVRTESDRVSCG